ncbi:MAG: hypothetical protein JWN69_1270 [Alphaproteobacteria bacterium]|nr:hypothetical protein [Alphaproteobacteria bacterium]
MRSAGQYLTLATQGLLVALLAGCVPEPSSPPPPAPSAPARLPPPPPPSPPPIDWRDLPLTPGTWSYRGDAAGSEALFGAGAQATFALRCDRTRGEISLAREGITSGNTMTVRTSSGARNFPLAVRSEPAAAVIATVNAADRFLDSMAFSRGRFTVEVPGTARLVIPAWAEPARVIEDCRG